MIEPYGGKLTNLVMSTAEAGLLGEEAGAYPSLMLTDRNLCDLELLACGAFSPLTTFLGQKDYDGVLENMRLESGTLWPMPIMLAIPDDSAIKEGDKVALRRDGGELVGVIEASEVFEYDKKREAEATFGTNDEKHPGVAALDTQGKRYISGALKVVDLPRHPDYTELRMTPRAVRRELEKRGWDRMVAFQTRNPLHRAHEELTKRAATGIKGGLLLHPVVGVTKAGDVDHMTRVRCYKALVENYYKKDEVILGLLPLAMRMGGPREAVWHAIIRRNYGATHIIVGRDHAGPGNDSKGNPFYGPYDAQELLKEHEKEIGVEMVPFQMVVYLPKQDKYVPVDEVPKGEETANISGTQVREEYLAKGVALPDWFSRPEVASILAEAYSAA